MRTLPIPRTPLMSALANLRNGNACSDRWPSLKSKSYPLLKIATASMTTATVRSTKNVPDHNSTTADQRLMTRKAISLLQAQNLHLLMKTARQDLNPPVKAHASAVAEPIPPP